MVKTKCSGCNKYSYTAAPDNLSKCAYCDKMYKQETDIKSSEAPSHTLQIVR